MKKASSAILVLIFASLFASLQSYAQIGMGANRQARVEKDVRQEIVNQNIRPSEILRLSDVLRLSPQEQNDLEISSLSISAKALRESSAGQIELSQNGRSLAREVIRKQLREVRILLPSGTLVRGLELSSQSELYIESISAEVIRPIRQFPTQVIPQIQGPAPHSLLTLQVNQSVRGYSIINLSQLVKRQLGLSLEGAQIERVIVQARSTMYGRMPLIQLELNNRPIGQAKAISPSQKQLPLVVNSLEEVRSLGLSVSGDSEILEIRIRVGQVRSRLPEIPRQERIYVGQEVSYRMPIELARLLPYESRLIRSITIEARSLSYGSAFLDLTSRYGDLSGSLLVASNLTRASIQLRVPMMASELRLEGLSAVLIENIEIEFISPISRY